jgi:hypothetical protein
MKLTNPKTGQIIESGFADHRHAAEFLSSLVAAGEWRGAAADFPKDLIEAVKRGKGTVSDGRAFWLHKLATEGKPKPTASGTFNLAGLRDLFAKASAKLKRPAIVLTIPGTGDEVKVSLAGPGSRYHGQLMIASPDFGSGVYYGRVTQEGEFFSGRSYSAAVRELLTDLANDPAATASRHGHLTGNCCFCRKALKDDRSTTVGYGPVCAARFGLSWGSVNAHSANP